jgi:phosphopantetheinyl transferase
VWARIDSWEDRRFDSDDAVWDVLMYPEANVLAVGQAGGYVTVREHWRGAASRELMMRRYLGERERAEHDRIGPRARRGWLLGRIAVKDAVRMYRWVEDGQARPRPYWPVEVEVRNADTGQPLVDGLHVSLAHKDHLAVAIVDPARPVGIDIERIEPRTAAFIGIAYTPSELALGSGAAHLARLWAAKEAVGKARGTGVIDPKRLVVRAADDGRLAIGDAIIDTHIDGDHVVAWTRL